MLFRLSRKIVLAWSKERIIEKESVEAYIYGVQLLLSTFINLCAISVISAIADRNFAWMYFLIGFIPIRITAGGFHAKTPFGCATLFCGTYFVCMFLLNVINDNAYTQLIIINSVASMLVIYLYSPLPPPNKPMSEKERVHKRLLSIAVVAILLLIIVTLLLLQIAVCVALYISCGEMIASIFCFSAKHYSQKKRLTIGFSRTDKSYNYSRNYSVLKSISVYCRKNILDQITEAEELLT